MKVYREDGGVIDSIEVIVDMGHGNIDLEQKRSWRTKGISLSLRDVKQIQIGDISFVPTDKGSKG